MLLLELLLTFSRLPIAAVPVGWAALQTETARILFLLRVAAFAGSSENDCILEQ